MSRFKRGRATARGDTGAERRGVAPPRPREVVSESGGIGRCSWDEADGGALAAAVLLLVGDEPITAADVAEALSVPVGRVRRALATLRAQGAVEMHRPTSANRNVWKRVAR